MKRLIKSVKKSDELTAVDRFLAGSSAGAISQTVIYPMEVSYPPADHSPTRSRHRPLTY